MEPPLPHGDTERAMVVRFLRLAARVAKEKPREGHRLVGVLDDVLTSFADAIEQGAHLEGVRDFAKEILEGKAP